MHFQFQLAYIFYLFFHFQPKIIFRIIQLAADEFDLEIQRQISKTFIRELATEKVKIERKLIVQIWCMHFCFQRSRKI